VRPVARGARPVDEEGVGRDFAEYAHARPHLIERMGDYCSFCEMQLSAALAVEHIRHKNGNPQLERQWENFLLACPSCNSTKGTKVSSAHDVTCRLWPHTDRTFDVYHYESGGRVSLVPVSDASLAQRAEATEAMLGLTRQPGDGLTAEQIKRGSDNRWKKRREAWDEAVSARTDLLEADTPVVRRKILAVARAQGFWSVWMTVFRDDPEMQRDLCMAFRGTDVGRVYPLPPHLRRHLRDQPEG